MSSRTGKLTVLSRIDPVQQAEERCPEAADRGCPSVPGLPCHRGQLDPPLPGRGRIRSGTLRRGQGPLHEQLIRESVPSSSDFEYQFSELMKHLRGQRAQ